jgi:hypothetical protein
MDWFAAEYARLQRSADKGAEAPSGDVDLQGGQPDGMGFAALSDRVGSPMLEGSEPHKENRVNRTERREPNKEHASGGLSGHADHEASVDAKPPQAANDNAGPESRDPFPPDAWDRFLGYWPNKVALLKAEPVFRKMAASGAVDWSEFKAGVKRYIENKPDTQQWMGIVKFIEERRWTDVYGPRPAPREARQRAGAAI